MSESLVVAMRNKSTLASVTEILESEVRTVMGLGKATEAPRLSSSPSFKLLLVAIEPREWRA